MRWGILGSILVADDADAEISLSAGRLRTLLAVLLARANHVVSIGELVEMVWDGTPPAHAVRTVRVHVVRLRQALGPVAAARIATQPPGYLCRVGEEELDVLCFSKLCRHARSAARERDWPRADGLLGEALGLWRGTPLADVPSDLLRQRELPRLDQLHVQAVEDHIDAEMHLGRHEELIPRLRDLIAAHPLRERPYAQIMWALARTGQRAEALKVYSDARSTLTGELGIEPGPELRDLHQRILAGDTEPTATIPVEAASAHTSVAAPVLRQLPAAPGHFTGRRVELDALTRLRDQVGQASGAGGMVMISAVDGMAGVGKTALVIHAAHRMAGHFPGGQLFLDLHAYTPGHKPRSPGEALETLLRALGVPPRQIPRDTDERAALYRQRLADRRILIVLDNAATEAQVRPLLPGSAGCLVLVTSRRRLKGLDDARTLSLDVLPRADAIALLRAVGAPGRYSANDPALDEIAELCGRLPLALRIAAAMLRHRPAWTPRYLAGLLRCADHRVSDLSDAERDLGSAFDLSYRALDDARQLLFRCLGLIPGPDFDIYAAATLVGTDPGIAASLLEGLVDHNMLIEYAEGRYRLHDLLRAYARTLAGHDPHVGRQTALDRLPASRRGFLRRRSGWSWPFWRRRNTCWFWGRRRARCPGRRSRDPSSA
jgi:DNA-binding SARP family transcriptional activator